MMYRFVIFLASGSGSEEDSDENFTSEDISEEDSDDDRQQERVVFGTFIAKAAAEANMKKAAAAMTKITPAAEETSK